MASFLPPLCQMNSGRSYAGVHAIKHVIKAHSNSNFERFFPHQCLCSAKQEIRDFLLDLSYIILREKKEIL